MASQSCYFHKSNPISTFCTSKQCTLPMCQECLPIHLQEHQQNFSQPSVLPYEEASKVAILKLQTFAKKHKQNKKSVINEMETVKGAILQSIQMYFESITQKIEESYGSIDEIDKKINKLKKGSIKTLIYFYSSEINMDVKEPQLPNFQEMKKVIEKALKNQPSSSRSPKKIALAQPTQSLYEKLSKKNGSNQKNLYQQNAGKTDFVVEQSYRRNKTLQKQNAPYEQEKRKQRMSIFSKRHENTRQRGNTVYQDKNSYNYKFEEKVRPNPYEIKESPYNIKENTVKEHSYGLKENSYNLKENSYNLKENTYTKKQNQYSIKESLENRIKGFENKMGHREHHEKLTSANQGFCYQNQQSPISFEQRYQKIAEQQHVFKPQTKIQQKEPLTISDLEGEKQVYQEKKYNYNYEYKVETHEKQVELNRNTRSYSYNHLKPQTKGFEMNDMALNREVMSPGQIRKMLEKRIEERSRILANKKSMNVTEKRQDDHIRIDDGWDHSPSRKWDAKDSIIHQIHYEQ